MKESLAMIEIRKIKDELSKKAREMTNKDFIEFINEEANRIKNSINPSTISK